MVRCRRVHSTRNVLDQCLGLICGYSSLKKIARKKKIKLWWEKNIYLSARMGWWYCCTRFLPNLVQEWGGGTVAVDQ